MNYQNDDLRIKEIKELLPPVALLEKFPATENAANTVAHARKAIHKILKGNDDRLLVVIGPCSIHDPVAAKEYATRLLALREELKDELEIVMRVYFEKPRTTVGWKGRINEAKPRLILRWNFVWRQLRKQHFINTKKRNPAYSFRQSLRRI